MQAMQQRRAAQQPPQGQPGQEMPQEGQEPITELADDLTGAIKLMTAIVQNIQNPQVQQFLSQLMQGQGGEQG